MARMTKHLAYLLIATLALSARGVSASPLDDPAEAVFVVGQKAYRVNAQTVVMDVAPFIGRGRTGNLSRRSLSPSSSRITAGT